MAHLFFYNHFRRFRGCDLFDLQVLSEMTLSFHQNFLLLLVTCMSYGFMDICLVLFMTHERQFRVIAFYPDDSTDQMICKFSIEGFIAI